jgi:copper type II ascorbate-dependent monooxygenase-like protein
MRVRALSCLLAAAFLTACGPRTPTWSEDIAPIAGTRCTSCHQPGGIAPFSMIEYASAKQWSPLIAQYTSKKLMPPWLPSQDCHHFRDQATRTLTDAEIATIQAWATAGAPEGKPGVTASVPVRLDLGTPSITLTSPTYTPAGTTEHPTDDYRCFKIDPGLTTGHDVVGFRVRPGNPTVVHHVILFAVDPTLAALVTDSYPCFGGPGIPGLTLQQLATRVTVVGAWAPGTGATAFPSDTGVAIAPGTIVIAQIHYNLLAGQGPDSSSFDLYYANAPVAQQAIIKGIPNFGFQIPPQTSPYTSSHTMTSPVGAIVYGVFPHMHLLGQEIRLDVDGQCAADVPAWNFSWQGFYFYDDRTVVVKPGSSLTVTCTWNNPTDRTVTWGEGTTDEMCLMGFYAVLQ